MELHELSARARKAFLLRDWPNAERFARELNVQKPGTPGILLFLGNIYTKMGDYNRAIQAFQESLELDDKNTEAYNNIGIVYRLEENLPAAVGALERARELAPERADIWYNLANVHKQMDEPEVAETYYRKAIELDPGLTRAYNNLGTLYQKEGKQQEAEEFYRRGISRDENNPLLQYNLGISYQEQQRVDEAISAFRRALKSRPNWVDGLNNLGILLEERGEYEEAARVIGNALQIEADNPKLNNNMGVVLSAQGRHNEAIDYLRRAVEGNPNYSRASLNLGTELEELGEYGDAWDHLQKLKAETPADLEIREKIARLALKSGKMRQAKEEIRFILDHNPNAGFAYSLLGKIHLASGDRKRAVQAYAKAISLDRDDLETSLNLALLYKEMKEHERSIAQASDILSRDPNHYAAKLLLGKLYLYQNLYSEALSLLEPLYERFPYDEELLETLIRAHKGAGNREEALRFTEELVHLQSERDSTLDLEKLEQTLHLYEEAVEAYAEEHERVWEENLKRLTDRDEAEPEPEEIKEEESLFFDAIPDLDQPAAILDVGGIEPVIVINEDEERLRLKEMEEEILSPPPEEEDEEEPPPLRSEVAMIGPAASPQPAAQPESPTPASAAGGDSGDRGSDGGGFAGNVSVNVPIQMPAATRMEIAGGLRLDEHISRREKQKITRKLRRGKPGKGEPGESPQGAAPAEDVEEKPAELLKYLEDLTDYLPEERKHEYEQSDMRLRLEALRERLEGKPSLRQQLERLRPPSSPREDLRLNSDSIESTLSFMGDLSTYLPNKEIGVALHHRIADILKNMKRDKHGAT